MLTGVLGGANFGKNVPTWNRGQKEANIGQTFVAVDPGCFAPDTLYDEGNDGKEINTEKRLNSKKIDFRIKNRCRIMVSYKITSHLYYNSLNLV